MKSYRQNIVNEVHTNLTLEQYLRQVMQYSGRSLQRLTRKKAIVVNGKPAFLQRRVKTGDQVRVYEPTDQTFGVEPEAGPVTILFEDDDAIVLDKPAYQLVHPAGQTNTGTLANHLAQYFLESGVIHTIRPLHRLDRDTSGCIVFAKHATSQHVLEQQMHADVFSREYFAIVTGGGLDDTGTIEAAIGAHPTLPNRRAIVSNGKGDHAVTHYKVIASCPAATCVLLTLETGRTHQIRLHMAHIGHPIIGDRMYGKRSAVIARQALHAYQITFDSPSDPLTKIAVHAPIPMDIKAAWKQLSGQDIKDLQ